RIKFSLLERDAVTKPDKVKMLEDLVGAYLKLPNLRLGITAIDYPTEKMIAHKYKIRFDFLAAHQEQLLTQANSNSIYEKACRYGEVLLVEDIEELVNKTPIEEGLLKQGIRSILVAPLFNQEKQVIGLLEIGSPRPYAIHSFVELQFKQLTGLFSIAVERSRDEIDNRIEATIREQYTAVHPSVEWKFIETTYNLIEQRAKDPELAVADPIIFNDVYPLYGQPDIVSSSSKRNRAILADLIDNLERVEVILEFAQKRLRFPLVNQYLYKIRTNIEGLKAEFNSNDESRIVEMLQDEIHPLLRELRMQHQDLSGPVTSYFNYLDEELQIVYRERKRYEDSVSKINSVIANYLETQQKEAQKILPHYFEKYKTDGVEYNMYVGQSLLNKHHFDLMHLQNLRLWQLIDMCNITRKVEHMKDSLEVPLTTAQLIFAYSTPLSIRFRMDEKQFDVDGAYNVRYEILKKRIDKARVADTDERLTVAGKVAIVYLNEKDKQEYMGYFDYLIAEGYIEEEVEDLTLGKLQGVQGLRALRVTVREGKE
ncbi:MAG: GAF domain-containing protein, partial [Bacteroidota bacterium]